MTNRMLLFTFRLLAVAAGVLMCLLLPFSFVGDAHPRYSSEPHFHGVLDAETMRTSDSLYAAAKLASNLNFSGTRTVRMIYFLPNDRPFRQEVVDSMKTVIQRIQTFFADKMEANGHGRKTFQLETDAQGDPVVHRVDGQHPDSHYLNQPLYPVLSESLDPSMRGNNHTNNVYFIVLDNNTGTIDFGAGGGVAGVGGQSRNVGLFEDTWWTHFPAYGYLLVPGEFSFRTVVHEFGHAFGLNHDFRDNAYIMSYGGSRSYRLSACAAEILTVHPCFNSEIPIPIRRLDDHSIGLASTIELVSPARYPAGASSVSLRLRVGDPEGLRQINLNVATTSATLVPIQFLEVKACRELDGERETFVEFDYDGVVPSSLLTGTSESISDANSHVFYVEAIDTEGYKTERFFGLAQNSPYLLATIEEGSGGVAFSPDGGILAFGSSIGHGDYRKIKVRLWDMAAGEAISAFNAPLINSIQSLAFSPDGETLAATAPWDRLGLWDVATRQWIRHPEGPQGQIRLGAEADITFSPAGNIVAFGSSRPGYKDDRGRIWLWDVAAGEAIATLDNEYSRFVGGLEFSPDGGILAAGYHDDALALWDVATSKEIVSFGAPIPTSCGGATAVAFSPAGNIVASGYYSGPIGLWDAVARETSGILEGHPSKEGKFNFHVYALEFSPGGDVLASASQDGTVRLWDVATREKVATLIHIDQPYSLAFSPDGTMLASGTGVNIELWDVAEFVTPVAVIPDANLRAVILDALGKQPFAPVSVPEMEGLTALDASNRDVRELDGLEFATNLTDLNLTGNPLSSTAIATDIPALKARGVAVTFDAPATPDFDGDGAVGFGDFVQFAGKFGSSQDDPDYDARFDLDGDGAIGFSDFLAFAQAFGS